jgi:putative flippase GtrA
MKNYQFTNEKLNYLIIGGLNTVFAYVSSFLIYYSLYNTIHILIIGVISNIINITFSFFTYKLLVFCTKGNWLKEYLRCYVVYGASCLIAIILAWILVDFLKIPFWLASGLLMTISIIFSYFGHSRFTFRKRKNNT